MQDFKGQRDIVACCLGGSSAYCCFWGRSALSSRTSSCNIMEVQLHIPLLGVKKTSEFFPNTLSLTLQRRQWIKSESSSHEWCKASHPQRVRQVRWGEVSNSLEGENIFAVTRACFLIEQYKNKRCVRCCFFSIIIQEPSLFSVIYRTFIQSQQASLSFKLLLCHNDNWPD